MWDYSEKVKDHFLHPRNVGEVPDADAVGEVGNIACGDALRLTLKLDNSRIVDAKFKTFGCGSAIAAASALTELVKGKTIEEAEKITNQDIADYLDGLPEEKMHCSVMGQEALEDAIANYRGFKKAPAEEGAIICKCFGVTDKRIERVIKENNLTTVDQVTHYTKAGGGCKSCHPDIQRIIDEVWGAGKVAAPKPRPAKKMSNIRKMQLIQETIEREIRPVLMLDGGDVELVDIEGDTVYVSFRGSCAECPSSKVTIKSTIESKLKEFVTERLVVEEVTP
ncbi:MAG: Fe-S cluster assembly protein NifU [Candidatus Brocadiales bacterium]